jgi:hypothetical protein
MKIYICGSLRNEKILDLTVKLQKELPNDTIFSDWYAAGPEADDHWKAYEQERGNDYISALANPAAQSVFNFDKKHILESDVMILMCPSGKSGHLETGWHAGVSFAAAQFRKVYHMADHSYLPTPKATYILLDAEDVRWDVMYNFVDGVFMNDEDLIREIGNVH